MSSNGEKLTLKLRHPVQLSEEDGLIEELRFRELTAGDMRGMTLKQLSGTDVDAYVKIIARLTGQHDALIRKLRALDFKAAMMVVDDFFDDGQTTEGEPSPS